MWVTVFLFGLVIGSFLNVCIYRLPRDLSIISPPSSCPSCKNRIRPWDNIPVLSYIILGGKCRYCGERISPRYPFVELLNGVFYLVVLWRYGITPSSVILMVYFSSLIVITFIDLDFQIIPDVITIPGAIIGVVAGVIFMTDPFYRSQPLGWLNSLIGASLGFGLFYLIAVLSRGGMGGGDIKMMAMVGALTGWKGVLLTTFVGSLTGSIIGIFLVIFYGKGRKTKVPFGPFLAFGSVVTVLFGEEILRLYLGG
ncbi:MAG: prepilin peptidase [Nitrospirae bacterium]|nr:MAG: prepilin peptidase [Nitrospirota bacterium]